MTLELGAPLPCDLYAERSVLGAVLLNSERFVAAASALCAEDFAIEKHRRVFAAMGRLDEKGERPDRLTVANELHRTGELESVDGLSYLVSLDDQMPQNVNLDGWVDKIIEKSRLRRIALAAQHILNRAIVAEDTADEILSSADAAMMDIRPSRDTKEIWKTPGMEIADHPGGLKEILSPSHATGIQTPFHRLNELTGGFRKQELILIAGRPGHGKTSLGIQFAWHAVKVCGEEVAYMSLEMSRSAITQRLIAIHGRADLHRMRLGYLNSQERQRISLRAADVQESCLWIDDRGGQTSSGIRRSVKQLCSRRPIGMLVVDHLHLVRGTDPREDERHRFNRIADDLQMLAKELLIPVLALAQLSRKCEEENRAPGQSDLKETGKLEENADLILCAYRPEMYHKNRERDDLKGIAEIIIPKQRNGPTGAIPMVFLGGMSMFQSRAEDEPEQAAEEQNGHQQLFEK